MLVNTSFNVRGEPIVCTPEDAFRCFMGSEIEVLVVGNCFLRKEDQDPALEARLQERLRARLARCVRSSCDRLGDPSVLKIEERPIPEPGPADVLIKVGAASVNFPDVLMLSAGYQHKPELPFVPGMEGAGTDHRRRRRGEGLEGRRPRDLRRATRRLRRVCARAGAAAT